MNKLKVSGIAFIIAVILAFILFILGYMRPMAFWATMAIAAVFAYKIMPKLRKSL